MQKGKTEITLRQCAATRTRLPLHKMIRFALDPNGNVVPDINHNLPGRGVWLSCDKAILTQAIERAIFPSAFKKKACHVDGSLAVLVDNLLVKSALQLLSLSNKAGSVVSGFTKVQNALLKGGIIALIHALEASSEGCRKLDHRFLAIAKDKNYPGRIIDLFASNELSLALGQPNVIHAALESSGVSERFLSSIDRIEQYRSGLLSDAAA